MVTEVELIEFLLSKPGALMGGAVLWLMVLWAKSRGPWIAGKLKSPWQIRAFAFVASTLPAVSLTLMGKGTWTEVGTVAVTAFLVATGLNRIAGGDGPKPETVPAKTFPAGG